MTKESPPLHPLHIYDIAIVGGGFIGLTAAIALAEAGFEVICLDKENAAASNHTQHDWRTTSIALGSKLFLDDLGIWMHLREEVSPILEIRVADQFSPRHVHYDHKEVGDQPLGWMIHNPILRRGLLNRTNDFPNLHRQTGVTITHLETNPYHATLHIKDHQPIKARLMVGADGRQSFCRQAMGIKTTVKPYNQTAIVCNIAHERPHKNVALEHFLANGPFAVLPLKGQRSAIVWTERTELAPTFMNMPGDKFNQELLTRAGEWLSDIRLESPRQAWPLSLSYAHHFTSQRLALIGDAAQAIHPLAGQGLNLGWRDAKTLAEIITGTAQVGLDIGTEDVLENYERQRRMDSLKLIAMTDGLNRLFSNTIPFLQTTRDLGLTAVNNLPPLKRFLMRQAMGVGGVTRHNQHRE